MSPSANFGKHHPKRASALKRRGPQRSPYQKILIVCEGQKTEPYYFTEFKTYYGLNTANIVITGDCGSDPVSIVNYAKQRYQMEQAAGDPFDRVYCVFDRDAHAKYREGLAKIDACRPKETYFAATSVPCFEYWLLLHFIYTTKPYEPLPGNSPCNQVITELKDHFPGYQKAQPGTFEFLADRLEKAVKHAKKAYQVADANSTDNPSAKVHEMIEFLKNIKTARSN